MRIIITVFYAVLGLYLYYTSEAFTKLHAGEEVYGSVLLVSVFIGYCIGSLAAWLAEWTVAVVMVLSGSTSATKEEPKEV